MLESTGTLAFYAYSYMSYNEGNFTVMQLCYGALLQAHSCFKQFNLSTKRDKT